MENYKLTNTESPEKRAQIKVLTIVAFIQIIISLVTESYANLFLLLAVMSFAYLVANTDDFFLVWDSAKGFLEKSGKNINHNSYDRYNGRKVEKENYSEPSERVETTENPKQTEPIQKISNNATDSGSVEVPSQEKSNNNNSVIWTNNTN